MSRTQSGITETILEQRKERLTSNKKNKRRTARLIWKLVVGFSIVLTIIVGFLKISGKIDLGVLLILPIYYFLVSDVPVYYAILFVVGILMALGVATFFRNRQKSCVLDAVYGRKIALMCQEPSRTEDLMDAYNSWKRQETEKTSKSPRFCDYIRLLEKQGFLQYTNEKWIVTAKALHYINKYHSRD